jgi:hypothetical protein
MPKPGFFPHTSHTAATGTLQNAWDEGSRVTDVAAVPFTLAEHGHQHGP